MRRLSNQMSSLRCLLILLSCFISAQGSAQMGENLLQNAGFEGQANWNLGVDGSARADGGVEDGAYCAAVARGGNELWSVALRQADFALTSGLYVLSFSAYSAEGDARVGVKVGQAQEPYSQYFYQEQPLTDEPTLYSFETEIFADEPDAQLELFLGGPLGNEGATLCFDNVVLSELPAQESVRDFPYIMVDQFGYRPDDPKVAVLVDPQRGFNADDAYVPGEQLELRRAGDERVVFRAAPTPWREGDEQSTSGDRGWWLDFSEVTEPGSYTLYDPKNEVRSYPFDIAGDVYHEPFEAALRMFYYNRANLAKVEPYADPRWSDGSSFMGPGQDTEARFVEDKANVYTARDLSGGWFDAGDYNKYVTFAHEPVHMLLNAYEQTPQVFTDDFNLPESGNGVPDLIDEVKWELDWLKKMQAVDGGVLIKVGNIDFDAVSPPSEDPRPRFYGPLCSSSTIAAASMFAHGALVFRGVAPLADYAADLERRAARAWAWYENNPKREDCDTQEIKAGDADRSLVEQDAIQAVAAVYLFALTGEPRYEDALMDTYLSTRPFADAAPRWSMYNPSEGDALLYYTTLKGADRALQQRIREAKVGGAYGASRAIYRFKEVQDLYRAYLPEGSYHWGSNFVRAALGSTNLDMLHYSFDIQAHPLYEAKALGVLHYLHGVNPLNLVYLTNMAEFGAERSASQMWHDWFADGTVWDDALTSERGPAPGYMTGGPNAAYSGQATPPAGEPAQKAYRDWNSGSGQPWEITEPAIYYQAAYIRLLANFLAR